MLSIEMIRRLIALLRQLLQRQRTRRQLLQLDDDQLKDIGIDRQQARTEGHKPFWKGNL